MLTRAIYLLSVAVLPLSASAVTFNITADQLKDQFGAPLNSGLVILAASTENAEFTLPTAFEFFPGADDYELGRWEIAPEADGFLQVSLITTLSAVPSWNTGDPLQLYWFPTLSLDSQAPGPLTPYGTYRRDEPDLPGNQGWITPGEAEAVSLLFLSSDQGGPSMNDGTADSFTPVPEPSVYGGAFALGCLAWVMVSRRRNVVQKADQ